VGLVEERQLGELAQHVEHVLLRVAHGGWCSLAGVAEKEAPEILEIAGREVRITHPGKLFFARERRLSKLELVRYYLSVAEGALRGIRDRPIVLQGFVHGA